MRHAAGIPNGAGGILLDLAVICRLSPPRDDFSGAEAAREREKLLHAYYAGAVPVDLLRSEQARLASETRQAGRHLEAAETSFGDIADTLAKGLDLLADCQRAYLAAPGYLRRQWNQALFERLVIDDEGIADAEVAEPFATWPIRSFRRDFVVRPSPEPALLLAAVQMRSF